jgi:ATP-binding cassette subfamily B protein
MRSLLETVGQSWSNLLFLENLFGFLAVEPTVVDPDEPQPIPSQLPPSVRFRSLSFAYPGTATPVFRDFDLEIRGGSTAALLGVNGAGKSTLFKLVCRFYDPDEGRIEIGGTDIRRFAVADVRGLLTALFQEPVHYSETVAENIAIGGASRGADAAGIAAAIRASGSEALIEKLGDGPETMLGTWFSGGAELSVGEWQRLALARALARDAPILLLDEPTAAMDSWSEAEWGSHLKEMAENRTVLIITHRLTTAMHADAIHIMDGGRIIESGTHNQLLDRNGPYRRAWRGQFGA